MQYDIVMHTKQQCKHALTNTSRYSTSQRLSTENYLSDSRERGHQQGYEIYVQHASDLHLRIATCICRQASVT
jgi:hypothetical protein